MDDVLNVTCHHVYENSSRSVLMNMVGKATRLQTPVSAGPELGIDCSHQVFAKYKLLVYIVFVRWNPLM